jgi:4-amino-4-deoxy-L-arabinose transferase-like glycosyltransferase
MVPNLFSRPFFYFITILLVYLMGLWGASVPLTGDQKVYLSIALEMFEKNEWVIPSLFNEPNFLKPPFQYWATIIGWKLFGLSVFGALVPSVIALLGSSFFCYQIGKKLNIKSPTMAAVLFASTIGSMTYGSTAQMEIWVVFFFLAAWFSVLSSQILLAFVLIGVLAWVKGPLYSVLWTACVLIWNTGLIKTKRFWLALLSGTLIGLMWYFLAASTHRQEILNQFVFSENLGKIYTAHGTIAELWGEFFYSLFPWGIVLFLAALQKNSRTKWIENKKFYLSYALVPLLFFTFFPYRVNSYLYLLTPIAAIMASEIDLKFGKKIKLIGLGIYSVIFVLLIFLTYRLVSDGWIGFEIVVSLLMTIVLFLIGYLKSEWKHVALSSLLLVNLLRVAAVQIGEKDVADLRTAFESRTGDYAFYIDSRDIWHEFGLISSVLGHSMQRIYSLTDLDNFLAIGGTVILQPEQLMDQTQKMKCTNWNRLKRRTKFPIQKLFLNGIRWADPELMRTYRICNK